MRFRDRLKLVSWAATHSPTDDRSGNPESPLSNPADWFVDWLTGGAADSGVVVSPQSAVQLTAVWACRRVLSEGLAALPKAVFKKRKGGVGKDIADDHYLNAIINEAPNDNMSSMDFFDAQQGNVVMGGNCYSWIEHNNAGKVKALWPLSPRTVVVEDLFEYQNLGNTQVDEQLKKNPNQLVYRITGVNGDQTLVNPGEVLHVRGPSPDGVIGISPLEAGRQAIGLGLATQKHGGEFFGDGATPDGVLSTDKSLNKEQRKMVLEGWKAAHQNKRNIAILSGGLKFEQVSVTPEQAQFLETRKFQVVEIARLFRVPPHMIADLERATFSNIEHQDLAFVKYSLMSWIIRWEQWLNLRLFSQAERNEGYFIQFNVDGLLRGDRKTRALVNKTAVLSGWKNRNEVREEDGMNPGPEELDEFLVPTNMANPEDDDVPAGGVGDGGTPGKPKDEGSTTTEVTDDAE